MNIIDSIIENEISIMDKNRIGNRVLDALNELSDDEKSWIKSHNRDKDVLELKNSAIISQGALNGIGAISFFAKLSQIKEKIRKELYPYLGNQFDTEKGWFEEFLESVGFIYDIEKIFCRRKKYKRKEISVNIPVGCDENVVWRNKIYIVDGFTEIYSGNKPSDNEFAKKLFSHLGII